MNKTHVAIGVAVSLLLHLLAAAWAWQHKATSPHFAEKAPVTVHLLPAPPKPAERAPPPLPPEPVKPNKEIAARNVHNAPHAAPAVVVATPTHVDDDRPPVPPPAPAQEKHLDMNAIYGSVKSTMTQIDRENSETPLGQLAAKPFNPPESGNKIGKMIDKTTRADCKEQVEGAGLFTPLLALATLLDKKDNGCKWR